MNEFSKYVGLDVHKETIAVSVAEGRGGEVRYLGEIANTAEAVAKLVRQLDKGGAPLSFCYEAGPCGYGVYRQLQALKQDCLVVAPSLIPRKAGERVKTDRRDSLNLARLHRAGELTAVWVPDAEHEALRDLVRAREDMKHLQRQASACWRSCCGMASAMTARATGRRRTTAGWRSSSSRNRCSRSCSRNMSMPCWPGPSECAGWSG